MTTGQEIERRLREALSPIELRLDDQSAQHAGHPGAVGGGGHFSVWIVSKAFRDLGRIERHRIVYGALEGLVGGAVHALAVTALTPEELKERTV